MRRQLTLLFAAFTATAIAACGSDSPDLTLAPTETDVAGSYDLVVAAGHTLPFFAFETDTESFSLAADRMILASDRTWVDTSTFAVIQLRDGSLGARVTATAGIYEIGNGQIKFVMTAGGSKAFTGSVTKNTLTVVSSQEKYVYNR